MKSSLVLLGCAMLALAGSADVRATITQELPINDSAIMDGIPRNLSEFGFFQDPKGRVPHGNLISYELNTPLYSDGADKLRYVYVPAGGRIDASGDGLLQFPVGSAIIKTFAFGEGETQRYIETRVLLNRADGWLALPYRWNDDQTEARLALAGARIPITRPDGEEISYRVPNKNQCKTCHSKNGDVIPIGPKVRNLPGEFLKGLAERGFIGTLPAGLEQLPVWGDDSASNGKLARAYLDVNCAHCHQPGGSASNSGLDLRWEQGDPHAIGIRKPPVAAGRGAGGHKVSIAPGDASASILVYRMESNDPGVAMPELGRSTTDDQAVAVMRKWIEEMPTS